MKIAFCGCESANIASPRSLCRLRRKGQHIYAPETNCQRRGRDRRRSHYQLVVMSTPQTLIIINHPNAQHIHSRHTLSVGQRSTVIGTKANTAIKKESTNCADRYPSLWNLRQIFPQMNQQTKETGQRRQREREGKRANERIERKKPSNAK